MEMPEYPNEMLAKLSFASFMGFKAKESELLWCNFKLLHAKGLFSDKEYIDNDVKYWAINEFAYITDSIGNENESKLFYAEYYGGYGISCNGGGGRTGGHKFFQIKGIGPTPLVSQNSGESYKNGCCSFTEVMKDAIWGEIGSLIFPHGAVRCFAIIKVEVNSNPNEKKYKYLCIRENCIRPAHFMRASFYKPLGLTEHNTKDFERVRSLSNILITTLKSNIESTNVSSSLNPVLNRWAEQVAFTQAYRLFHGALTPSNICLDGRWIDFGTMSSIGHHCNVVIARGNLPFWSEPQAINNIIEDFVYTINKYHLHNESVSVDVGKQVFKKCFDVYFKIYLLQALGVNFINDYFVSFNNEVNILISSVVEYLHIGTDECFFGIPKFSTNSSVSNLNKIITRKRFPIGNLENKIEKIVSKLRSYNIIKISEINLDYDFLNVDSLDSKIVELEKSHQTYEKTSEFIDTLIKNAERSFCEAI